MNKIQTTAVSNAIEILLLVGVSAAISGIASYLTNNPGVFNPVITTAIATILKLVVGILDPLIPNI